MQLVSDKVFLVKCSPNVVCDAEQELCHLGKETQVIKALLCLNNIM